MNLTHRFWPAGRRLFRRQGRWPRLLPVIVFVGGSVLMIAVGTGWFAA